MPSVGLCLALPIFRNIFCRRSFVKAESHHLGDVEGPFDIASHHNLVEVADGGEVDVVRALGHFLHVPLIRGVAGSSSLQIAFVVLVLAEYVVGEFNLGEDYILLVLPVLNLLADCPVMDYVVAFSILVLPDLEIIHYLEVHHNVLIVLGEGHKVGGHPRNLTLAFISLVDGRARDGLILEVDVFLVGNVHSSLVLGLGVFSNV